MCPTSNIQTKAVSSYLNHPIYQFQQAGIKVTISTDNRTVSDTTMTNEMLCIQRAFATDELLYYKIYQTAVEAAFASEEVKAWCLAQYIDKY
jgi:adenosine deaminase